MRYGDAVRELDHAVGSILQAVRRLDLASDTLAVFSSDNGAATYAKTAGNISVFSVLQLPVFSLLLLLCALHLSVQFYTSVHLI